MVNIHVVMCPNKKGFLITFGIISQALRTRYKMTKLNKINSMHLMTDQMIGLPILWLYLPSPRLWIRTWTQFVMPIIMKIGIKRTNGMVYSDAPLTIQ